MHVEADMRVVVELPVEDEADAPPPEYSDEALALRFAAAHEETLRFIAAWVIDTARVIDPRRGDMSLMMEPLMRELMPLWALPWNKTSRLLRVGNSSRRRLSGC